MSGMKLNENTGTRGFNPQNSQWRIWNMWCRETSKVWNDWLGQTDLDLKHVQTDEMEFLFSSVVDTLDGATSDFPGELFLKQSRMFLVQPFTEDRFSFNDGNCEFELDAKELFQSNDPGGKSGEKFEIISYEELAVLLDKSFINSEIWIVHGGVVAKPTNFRTGFDCTAPNSLQLNKANLQKPVQILRIHVDKNETRQMELLLEDLRPAGMDMIKFTYTAKAGIKTVAVTRTRGIRSNFIYETSLDRWCFPILAPSNARKGYRFLLSNNWNKDPSWMDGETSISPKGSLPIFTAQYTKDEVYNRKKVSRKNNRKLCSFKAVVLWGILTILILMIGLTNHDNLAYPTFGNLNGTNISENSWSSYPSNTYTFLRSYFYTQCYNE